MLHMSLIQARTLADDLPFGARVTGVDRHSVKDEAARKQIKDLFEDRGFIVFEDMEPSGEMQLELASIFGPLQEHAMKAVRRSGSGSPPGVFVLNFHPSEADIFEVDGKPLSGWVPWHYDACYMDKLYRGAVLRALDIPPEGGLTGFADGMQIYNAISPELRDQFDGLNIVYQPSLMFTKQRFGMPTHFGVIRLQKTTLDLIEQSESAPRAIHPAIWTRKSGERVLHVSPWQAAGIEGHEDRDGDALLERLCRDIYAKMTPYFHRWKPTDMLIWDNWRFIHSVSGHNPEYARRMHRAGIAGDYGLGRWEATDIR
jgi:taurine dioxygenase